MDNVIATVGISKKYAREDHVHPLNKNYFLSDATAEALGLTGDSTVDDALNRLSSAALLNITGGDPIYTPVTPNFQVGDLINLQNGDSTLSVYVAQIGYPVEGVGTNILFRTASIYNYSTNFSSDNGPYDGGKLDTAMNTTFYNSLHPALQSAIAQVDIPLQGDTIARKVFVHSVTEAGLTDTLAMTEGTELALYRDTAVSAYSSTESTWTRTQNTSVSQYAFVIGTNGALYGSIGKSATYKAFAYFCIPSDAGWYYDSENDIYSFQQSYTPTTYEIARATAPTETLGTLSYSKLMEINVDSDVDMLEIDLSGIDLTQYAALKITGRMISLNSSYLTLSARFNGYSGKNYYTSGSTAETWIRCGTLSALFSQNRSIWEATLYLTAAYPILATYYSYGTSGQVYSNQYCGGDNGITAVDSLTSLDFFFTKGSTSDTSTGGVAKGSSMIIYGLRK